MTLNKYLLVMITLTTICWGIFLFVARMIDPGATNWLGFLLFYVSLFIALSGLTTIIGFLIRFVALKKELAFNLVKIAFRQSFLFSLFFVCLLLLLMSMIKSMVYQFIKFVQLYINFQKIYTQKKSLS